MYIYVCAHDLLPVNNYNNLQESQEKYQYRMPEHNY